MCEIYFHFSDKVYGHGRVKTIFERKEGKNILYFKRFAILKYIVKTGS